MMITDGDFLLPDFEFPQRLVALESSFTKSTRTMAFPHFDRPDETIEYICVWSGKQMIDITALGFSKQGLGIMEYQAKEATLDEMLKAAKFINELHPKVMGLILMDDFQPVSSWSEIDSNILLHIA